MLVQQHDCASTEVSIDRNQAAISAFAHVLWLRVCTCLVGARQGLPDGNACAAAVTTGAEVSTWSLIAAPANRCSLYAQSAKSAEDGEL